MTDVYLVRHGETEWNRQRRIQGLTDIPLNATGREQARLTGLLLTRRPISRVVASPLGRARETAEIIATQIGLDAPQLREAFVERNYGAAEGLDFHEIDVRYPPGVDVPGRESREDVAARVIPALQTLAAEHPGEAIVVVSHGGAIRAALMTAAPGSGFGPITNGSVHSFHVDGADLRLVAFDDPIELAAVDPRAGDIGLQNAVEARE
ncbi:histidine phosphatase family protein [Pseudolysinimonas sp.]|uniref:histidine phosphatase family protein n=1 Tax=Pseudolysinimonas sp. TaxID=2680009 RepID=UPI00286BE1B2|nr:histidine phosphatase family protein [Pseudolysinimonas sp.]